MGASHTDIINIKKVKVVILLFRWNNIAFKGEVQKESSLIEAKD